MDIPFPEPPATPPEPPAEPPAGPALAPAVPPPPPPRRFFAGRAWLAVLVITVLFMVARAFAPQPEADETAGPGLGESIQLFQARYLVGSTEIVRSLSGGQGGEMQMAQQLDQMQGGSVTERLRIAVLASEVGGRAAAARSLDSIDEVVENEGHELTEEEATLRAVLTTLYADRGDDDESTLASRAAALPEDDRATLREKLGWHGRLALLPVDTADAAARQELLGGAKRVAIAVFVVGVLGCLGVLAGFAGALLFVVLLAGRSIALHLPPTRVAHGIYAETFAVWFATFVGLQLALGLSLPESLTLAAGLVSFFGSLVALRWPLHRGVDWADVKADLGLHTGRGVLREVLAGATSYVISLPLISLGVLATIVAMVAMQAFSADQPGPLDPMGAPGGHPIVQEIASGSPMTIVLVFLLAVVAAPVVEEIGFRGLLYRHLRGLSERHERALSFLFAAPLTSLFFAAIHPQGLIGIPALTCIAMGMTVAREWRDSVIAPMVFHAINNGLVMSLALAMFSA